MSQKVLVKPDAKSPYQRYGKSEYLYSSVYKAWRDAIRAGRRDDAERFSRQHQEMCARQAPLWNV